MSKYRVQREMIAYDSGPGPLRVQLIYADKALALFSVRERQAILKDCAQHMGDFWIDKWLPARFTGYARRALGYRSTSKYDKHKRSRGGGEALPLVYNGELQEATAGATAKGQAGGNAGPSVIIRIPTGPHFIAANVRAVLNTVPTAEVDQMAADFGERLRDLINNRESKSQQKRGIITGHRSISNLVKNARARRSRLAKREASNLAGQD